MTHTSANNEERVLVLQGGGALGAYQAGVFQALSEARVAPEWVAGISIGAINAALIAGNQPGHRVERLREFWQTVSSALPTPLWPMESVFRAQLNEAAAMLVLFYGVPGFFTPRLPPPQLQPKGTMAAISYYDTAPLTTTLERLVDFKRINSDAVRLSVGAVNVRTGNFAYFDSAQQRIDVRHIMASAALPPGFPPPSRSTANITGMAASSRTRRSNMCSTTPAIGTASCFRWTCFRRAATCPRRLPMRTSGRRTSAIPAGRA